MIYFNQSTSVVSYSVHREKLYSVLTPNDCWSSFSAAPTAQSRAKKNVPSGQTHSAWASPLGRLQCLTDIRNDVIHMFNANGETHHVGTHPGSRQFRFTELAMGGGGGMTGQ